jgi:hypothetical protein
VGPGRAAGSFWLGRQTADIERIEGQRSRLGLLNMGDFSANAASADPCDFLTNCVQQSNLRC